MIALEDKIREEIRVSKAFITQKRTEIDKLRFDVRYYEGQIDALNLTLSMIEKEGDPDACNTSTPQ